MAGHSQFKNIMYRKNAQDTKRAKMFTKLIRELMVAAKEGGGDPTTNARLRSALMNARSANVPKDTIERAIKRGEGDDDAGTYAEIRYEGYGPGGVAILVEALTDNRNRTAPEVRAAFHKHGGNLGEPNSVSFLFQRVGLIVFSPSIGTFNDVFEAAVEAGAENVEETSEGYEVTTTTETFVPVRDALAQQFGDALTARLVWQPHMRHPVADDHVDPLLKLLDVLEDNDDVQNVFTNMELSEAALKRLA